MKRIILLIAIAMLSSCCTSDDNHTTGSGTEKRLVKMTTDIGEAFTTQNFHYTNGLISKIDVVASNNSATEEFEATFAYQDGKIMSILFSYENPLINHRKDFEYTNGAITKQTDVENGDVYIHNYEYDQNGFLKTDKKFNEGSLIEEYNYVYDTNNNMLFDEITTYTYNATINPISKIYPESYKRILTNAGKNNIIRTERNSGQISSNYTNTFDSSGNLIKTVIDNSEITPIEIEYFYE